MDDEEDMYVGARHSGWVAARFGTPSQKEFCHQDSSHLVDEITLNGQEAVNQAQATLTKQAEEVKSLWWQNQQDRGCWREVAPKLGYTCARQAILGKKATNGTGEISR